MKKYKNTLKKTFAMLFAVICIVSTMSMAFADKTVVGWPSDGGDDSANVGTTEPSLSPTDSGTTPTEDKQEAIDYKNWGESDISATINKNTTADSKGDIMSENIYAQYSDALPDVSIDDLVEWSNRKGFEIIKFLQTFIQPFAIIIFMIAAIMVLIGSIGNSQIAGKGMMGLVMSVLVYAAVLYSPSILSVLVSWLGS